MKKYDSYKDSGAKWLGEFPEHWVSYRIDWVSKIVRGNTGFKRDELLNSGEYVALQYGKTYKVDIIDDNFNFYVNNEFYKETQIVSKGDTILISTSETIEDLGHTCYYDNDKIGLIGGEQILLKPNRKLLYEKYLYRYAQRFCEESKKYAKGLKVFRFNTNDLKRIFIALPPIKEQTQIANYLDYKTTQIDDLISKKENLIELLKEERTAIINQAVTKGLDPNVPMKDSGIEWLGEIPEHWEVLSFRFCIDTLTDFTSNGSFASLAKNVNYLDEGYSRLVRLTDLRVGLNNHGVYVDENAHKFLKNSELFGGEMLIANVGAYAGLVKIMPKLEGKHTLGPNMFLLKLNQNIEFFYHQLNAPFCAEQLKMMAISSAQPKLNKDNMKQLMVVKPPIEEQGILLKFIVNETNRIDELSLKVEKEIELLKEYKTALISEVVTGKVDVRDEITH